MIRSFGGLLLPRASTESRKYSRRVISRRFKAEQARIMLLQHRQSSATTKYIARRHVKELKKLYRHRPSASFQKFTKQEKCHPLPRTIPSPIVTVSAKKWNGLRRLYASTL